jgi:hypothetical protein
MRGTNLVLFAIAGFLLIGISYVLLTGDTGGANLARSISSGLGLSSTPAVNPPAPPDDPEPAPTKAEPRPAVKAATASKPEAPSPAAGKKSSPAPEPLVVPKVDQVPSGTMRADLLARFPSPSVQTSTLHDGDLTEIFVYQNSTTPTATFIQLRAGVVVAAYTGIPARRLPN